MPRSQKCRRVCCVPENRLFMPENGCSGTVLLTVEELETVRLCDLEGLEQDGASASMEVSRATLQRILYQARRKIAEALCTGMAIEIGGGHYMIAQQQCTCPKRCRQCRFEEEEQQGQDNGIKAKAVHALKLHKNAAGITEEFMNNNKK
ncbi:MAG: DUF134 domain-containing protein [Eubacteriales bacterium]